MSDTLEIPQDWSNDLCSMLCSIASKLGLNPDDYDTDDAQEHIMTILAKDIDDRLIICGQIQADAIAVLDSAKETIIEGLQSSYDTDGYNGCGDDSMPLIELEQANCIVEDALTK